MAIRRRQVGRNHSYTINDTKTIGVTTAISNGWPKPGLNTWYARSVAEMAADLSVDEWQVLRSMGRDATVAALSKAPNQKRDGAAVRGTKVHKIAEKLILGVEVDVPEELYGHVQNCARFMDQWKVRPLLIERVVGSYQFGYAGTFDLIAELPDLRRILFDYKTGASGIHPETAMQLSAYRYADAYVADDGTEIPMVEVGITGCAAVWVRSDGYDVIPVKADQPVFRAFLHTLQVAKQQPICREWVLPAIQPGVQK